MDPGGGGGTAAPWPDYAGDVWQRSFDGTVLRWLSTPYVQREAMGMEQRGTTVLAEGQRWDDAANTVRLPGFATVDLRVEYALGPAWTLQASASNVFDRDYETVAWYNQPGREYGVRLKYRPAR